MTPRLRRAAMLLRLLAAAVGGYVLASVAAMAIAWFMPWCCGWSRAEGVLAGSLLSFVLYLAAAIWLFSAPMRCVIAMLACSVAVLPWLA